MLKSVTPGDNVPEQVNVIIEIPAYSEPVKYEVDKATGALFVDRFMTTAMHYPCDYGYIPETLSEDGDPVDVLVVSPMRLLAGSVIKVRPVGMLNMTDEKGRDTKILAVPTNNITTIYSDINDIEDLDKILLSKISHFFEHYKDLEDGKWVKVEGWVGSVEAKLEIEASINRAGGTT